jgi:hypothetical protein
VYSFNNTNPVFLLVLVPLVLLLSSCSERSEYGKRAIMKNWEPHVLLLLLQTSLHLPSLL